MTDDQHTPDIAIVGMAGLFPGAPDLRAFWQNILDGVDAVQDASEQWTGPYFDPKSGDNARIYTRKGGFLGDHVAFDPTEHGIMPSTVPSADPDHFLALKLARDALRDAGYADRPFPRDRTGVILGRGTYISRGYSTVLQHGQIIDQTLALLRQLHPELSDEAIEGIRRRFKDSLPLFGAEVVPSFVPNIITGRIANRLDLMGPNYMIDAACASSLLAIEQAIGELRSGRCDMVLTGGVHSTTPPQTYMMFCQIGGLSKNRLRPFDQGADGTLLGEGLGILVLKRLADSERDGDRIYALIKGVGSASDGRALGLLAPRLEGQVAALERAYRNAGIDPESVTLIEAHGTGIPLGDKTEVETLRRIFGGRGDRMPPRAIGSVKSMIGHCIPAAGAAGMIKAAMALHDKVLPTTLCDAVSPALEVENTSVYVNNRTRPWIHGSQAPRRAAVNAFGFGGINAHVILEEYRRPDRALQPLLRSRWESELLLFAGENRDQLCRALQRVRDDLAAGATKELAEVARAHAQVASGAWRMAVVARDLADLQSKLESAVQALAKSEKPRFAPQSGIQFGLSEGAPGRTAFLFPGEGGQYQNMMADLCLHLPQVRAWFDLLDESFAGLSPLLPSQVIFPPPTSLTADEGKRLEAALLSLEMASAAVFTAGMAMYELLTMLAVRCDVMVGHSTGEGTALVASGIVRFKDRDELKRGYITFNRAYRSLVSSGGIPRGALLTVGAAKPDLLRQILDGAGGRLHLALDNCPNQAVLYGEQDDIGEAAERLKDSGAICSSLPFDRAYHTPLLADVAPVLRRLYDSLEIGSARVPVYSCATVAPFGADAGEIRTLATSQWFSRVRFRETIETLHAQGVRNFIEIGPGANLTGFVRDTLHGKPHLAMACNMAGKPGLQQLQQMLGRLFVTGLELDLAPLFAGRVLPQAGADMPKAKGGRVPMIEMTMPRMKLPDDFVAELRRQLTPSRAETPRTLEVQQANATVPQATVPQTTAPPLLPPTQPAVEDATLTGVKAHFDLMRQFLESQSRIMAQFGGEALQEPRPAAAANGASAPESRSSGPLLGRVVERSETSVTFERILSVDMDRYLVDHTIGSPPSSRHPELGPLPIVPFTFSVEMVAEAALSLFGGHGHVTRLYDLRGYRWIAVPYDRVRIAVCAQLTSGSSADGGGHALVRISVVEDGGRADARQLVFEGRAEVAGVRTSAPAPMPFALEPAYASHYRPDMIYGLGERRTPRFAPVFHGPRFRGIAGIRSWGRNGVEADMIVLPRGDLCADVAQPDFQTDPVLIDAAGQLIVFWLAERFGVDMVCFPFAIQSIEQFVELPPEGMRILCRADIRMVSPTGAACGFDFIDRSGQVIAHMPSDSADSFRSPAEFERCRIFPSDAVLQATFDFLDPSGRVLLRVSGWQDRYFSLPHRYYRSRLWPQLEYFSEPWLQTETGRICRHIDVETGAFMEQSWGLWLSVFAHLMLSARERAFWGKLPNSTARRREWLLGRIAAKDAVRQWAAATRGVDLAPADITILPDDMGRPVIDCPPLAATGSLPAISISHSRGHVVAALSQPGASIGIDIARLEDVRSIELLKKSFAEPELELLDQRDGGSSVRDVVSFWCAKEAASKAGGHGLGGDPARWVVRNYERESGKLVVNHANTNYRVQVWHLNEEVLAIC